ncbi:MAG: hypothetical protein IPK13_04605 [Deltaproteobacteria bacterium]|nr:hypothetical protein [Deltaproteobacteria bacterium]
MVDYARFHDLDPATRFEKNVMQDRLSPSRVEHPLLVGAAIRLGIRIGQESVKLHRGEIGQDEYRARTGTHVGAAGGTLFGTAVGAWLGGRIPGIGRIVGAFVGGLLGDVGGEQVGHWGSIAACRILKRPQKSERKTHPRAPRNLAPRKRSL